MAEFSRSLDMAKRIRKIEIIESEEGRSLLKVYTDGSEDRTPIVKQEKPKKRLSSKIAWYRDLRTGRRIFY